jgi:hypothetical protein
MRADALLDTGQLAGVSVIGRCNELVADFVGPDVVCYRIDGHHDHGADIAPAPAEAFVEDPIEATCFSRPPRSNSGAWEFTRQANRRAVRLGPAILNANREK